MKTISIPTPLFAMHFVVAACLWAFQVRAEDRLWVDCKVNGKPVRLAFDTGADRPVLFAGTAERLGLKYHFPKDPELSPSPNQVIAGVAEECEFDLSGQTVNMRFRVLNVPSYIRTEADGVLAWWSFRKQIIWIDAGADQLRTLKKLPADANEWQQFRLLERDSLAFAIPGTNQIKTVAVDTGSEGGLYLAPEFWQQWRAAHPGQQVTLVGSYLAAAGAYVKEVAWADKIAVGPLVFTDIPIIEAHPTEIDDSSSLCVIGLRAMKHLQMVTDGERNSVYIRMKKAPAVPFDHNRLGAVFFPDTPGNNDLIAHVADGSPAQTSGIRNGDVLLKINGMDVTGWHTNKTISVNANWQQPAGTRFHLVLGRGQQTNEANVTLEDILGRMPAAPTSPLPKEATDTSLSDTNEATLEIPFRLETDESNAALLGRQCALIWFASESKVFKEAAMDKDILAATALAKALGVSYSEEQFRKKRCQSQKVSVPAIVEMRLDAPGGGGNPGRHGAQAASAISRGDLSRHEPRRPAGADLQG